MCPLESAEQDKRDKELKELILSVLVHEKPNTVRELVNGVLVRVETDLSVMEVVRLVLEMKEEGTIILSEPSRRRNWTR